MGARSALIHVASRTVPFALILAAATGLSRPLHAQAPGVELFAKEPKTPLELWDAIDYLLRSGQVKKALPFLDKFQKSNPDDATWNVIWNRYGPASVLSLGDDPATRQYVAPFSEAMAAAHRKIATDPKRIEGFVASLTRSREEQDYAVRGLRRAGADAIPFLIKAVSRPGIKAEDREQIWKNIGRLDLTAVPPLVAVLDSPDAGLAANAATALASIGDSRAIPYLTFPAAAPTTAPALREAARAAIARLTGLPFEDQRRTPVEVLTDAAWQFHRHQVDLGPEPVAIWTWDEAQAAPTSRNVPRTEAEAILGSRFAHDALTLAPGDRRARSVQLSLPIEKAIEKAGFTQYIAQAQDQPELKTAKSEGPAFVAAMLKAAIADGKTDLAAVIVSALGSVTNEQALAATRRPHPLVDALYSPGRRLQFAAAQAIVKLAPKSAFPGAARVVPTLARFIGADSAPRRRDRRQSQSRQPARRFLDQPGI